MKISRIRSQILVMPQADPLANTPEDASADRPIVILRLDTDDGIEGIGVTFYRHGKCAPRVVAVFFDATKCFERKFGIHGQQFAVAQENYGIHGFATRKSILRAVLRFGKRIFEQAIERHFAQNAARFYAAQNGFERLLRGA